MIIFYSKTTGKIVGNIEGRIHGDEHLNMWMGDKDKTDRIVVNWTKSEGQFSPDVQSEDQLEIYKSLDKNPMSIYDYKIDINTKNLVKK